MLGLLPDTDLKVDVAPYEDVEDGKDHKTHIVNPPNNMHIWMIGMTSQEIVDTARMTGQHVVALCGYSWIPKRNPEKYDVCGECMDVAGELMRGNNE